MVANYKDQKAIDTRIAKECDKSKKLVEAMEKVRD